MSSNRHRLRKLQRRKDRNPTERIRTLYWRYWHKVYGGHGELWRIE